MEATDRDVDPARPLQLDDPEQKLRQLVTREFNANNPVSAAALLGPDGVRFLRDLAALAARVQKLRGLDFDALAEGLIAPGNGVEGTRTEGETVEEIEAKVDRVSADVAQLGKEHNILQAELHRELDKLSDRFESGRSDVASRFSSLMDQMSSLSDRLSELEEDRRSPGE